MKVTHLLLPFQCLIAIHLTWAQQYPQSPCPSIFSYRRDPNSQSVVGDIEMPGFKVGQAAKLDVQLSIGAITQKKSSLELVKSIEETYKDIANGRPAKYRVIFPVQNPLPVVVSIKRNDQTVCTGPHVQGSATMTVGMSQTILASEPRVMTSIQPSVKVYPDFSPLFEQPRANFPITTATNTRPKPAVLNENICGKSALIKNILSINGRPTKEGQFPWIVPLFDRRGNRKLEYFCGSSLVSRKHLLTAAHCVVNKGPASILAIPGMHNIEDVFDPNAEHAAIQTVIVHPDYFEHDGERSSLDADIAILTLKTYLIFSERIRPVCLWQGSDDLREVINHRGLVAGWGITEAGSTAFPNYVMNRILSKQKCRENIVKEHLTFHNRDRIFCGDGEGSIPCNGDSGSGFMIKLDNQYFLRGILFAGVKDAITLKCDVTKFAMYTDIAQFRYWITQNIE